MIEGPSRVVKVPARVFEPTSFLVHTFMRERQRQRNRERLRVRLCVYVCVCVSRARALGAPRLADQGADMMNPGGIGCDIVVLAGKLDGSGADARM